MKKKAKRKNKPVVNQHNHNNDTRWSEVEDLYTAAANAILDVAISVNHCINKIKGQIEFENNRELINAVKCLSADINHYTNDLATIHSRHSDKTGYVRNSDDLALALGIFEDYANLMERFKGVAFHNLLTITEIVELNPAVADAEQVEQTPLQESEEESTTVI